VRRVFLVLAAGSVLFVAGFASAATRDNTPKPPIVEPISATFSRPVTTYDVNVQGGTGKIQYAWANSNDCGTFTANGATAAWSHPDSTDPNAPGHDFQPGPCPNEPVHPAAITVTVTDDHFKCVAGYSSSAPGVAPEGGLCVAQERPGTTTTAATTTTTHTSPPLIAHIVNPVDDPAIAYKKMMAELSAENFQTAKDGGLLSFIPGWSNLSKAGALTTEENTFIDTLIGKLTLGKLGAAGLKKAGALISIFGDVSSITFNVAGGIQGWIAQDPPRYDYGRFTSARDVQASLPPSVTAGVPAAVVSAANALYANGVNLAHVQYALLTSFERAQGAYHAGDGKAESQQATQTAKLATQAVALVKAQPALAAGLAQAMRAAGVHGTISAADVKRGAGFLSASSPGPAALLAGMHLPAKLVALVNGRATSTPAGAVVVPDFIAPANASTLASTAAARLQAFAADLNRIAAKTK
jgi:hypothetical protein